MNTSFSKGLRIIAETSKLAHIFVLIIITTLASRLIDAMFSSPDHDNIMILVATPCLLLLYFVIKTLRERLFPDPQLPPGSLGWPLLGETLQFLPTRRTPKPERFVSDRMKKYNPQVFKTSLFGETVAVFCGPAGNKFLFSNENKLVNLWWPTSVKKLMKSSLSNVVGDDAKRMRKMLLTSLDRDALKRYIDRMDLVAQNHIRTHWEGIYEVSSFSCLGKEILFFQ